MADLVKVTIDGHEALVPKGTLVVEAARQVGIEIPVFCYHEKMHPVGACRMCLVEIEKNPKLQAACTTPVADGMVVRTDTPTVLKARRGVVEFLLINHPLDCPVCDKGGECQLQDTAFEHGGDKSRFIEEKRHFTKPIRLSPLILLDRERCIMCSRCVRFQREIACDEALTFLNRGAQSMVGVLPGRSFDSPFSGNTIELCPVGALTSTKFRFRARSWETRKTPSICSLCSVGCNIKVETRNGKVVRITSRENPEVDDGWLCDRGRFTYDFVNDPARLAGPMVRRNGDLVPVGWDEALDVVARGLKLAASAAGSDALGGLISPRSTNEELYLFQKLFRAVLQSNNVDHGPHEDYSPPEAGVDASTGTIAALESAQVIVLAGVDPLARQPVLDLRLKKAATKKGATLVSVSSRATDLAKLTGSWLRPREGTEAAVVSGVLRLLLEDEMVRHRLGTRYESIARAVAQYTPRAVQEMAGVNEDALRGVAGLLARAANVAILFPRPMPGDPVGLQEACGRLAMATGSLAGSGGLYPLGTESNSQGAIDMGVLPNLLPGHRPLGDEGLDHLREVWGVRPPKEPGLSGLRMADAAAAGRLKALYVLGLDPAGGEAGSAVKEALSRVEFLVVQDLFLTETAKLAHVVLPATSFAEKEGTFTNLERRVQRLGPAPVTRVQGPISEWQGMVEIANALGAGWSYGRVGDVFDEISMAVPIYRGLRYDELGPQGRRWRYPGLEEAAPSHNGHARKLWYQPRRIDVPSSVAGE